MIDYFTYCVYLGLLFLVLSLTYAASLGQPASATWLGSTRLPKQFLCHLAALLVISFVVGFRYEVGSDLNGYISYFESLSGDSYVRGTEWGYFWINRVIADLGGNYALVFFIVALISWSFIFKSVPAVL
jgi:transmembrane protein EpsG